MLYTIQQVADDFSQHEKTSVSLTETDVIRKDGAKYLPEGFSELYSDFCKKESNVNKFELHQLLPEQRFQIYASECFIPMMDKKPLVGMNVYYNQHDSEAFDFVETYPLSTDNKTIQKSIRPPDGVNSVMLINHEYARVIIDIEDLQTCL
jgi:hypothetical protein